MDRDAAAGALTVSVRNVGGIDDAELAVSPGVTVLSGENATNRTSLLTAIAGAIGGSRSNLKSDAEAGSVGLEVGGTTYTRRYRRREGSVAVDGEPYTDEAVVVDLFVSLLEDNPLRRAVERGDDLRDLVMRPIDTEAIERRIRTKREERDRLRDRIAEIVRRCERLPDLERRREEAASALAEVETRIEELDARETDDASPAVEAAEERVQALERLQREHRETMARLDTEESSLTAVRREREDLVAELEDVECRDEELSAVEDELEGLRRRERELAESIDDLTAINQFNRELLADDAAWADSGGAAVEQLDPASSTLECWTCGSRVERGSIRERLAELESVTEGRRRERAGVRERIEALRERRDELRSVEDRRDRVEARLTEINDEIERREARVADLEGTAAELDEEIASVRERLERDKDLQGEHRERYQERTELEYERGQLEAERCELDGEIETLRGLRAERDQVGAQLEEVESELECARTHVRETEEAAVETFNEHVDEVLSLLDYGNVARVWIERRVDGAGSGEESSFVLHVVREREDGTAYEDDVSTLSESEREVVGLVVALAGYLVHDVGEQVPVMLLDSLEAIDGERIADLVEYFSAHVPYLLVALLPEDAAAVGCEHEEIPAGAF